MLRRWDWVRVPGLLERLAVVPDPRDRRGLAACAGQRALLAAVRPAWVHGSQAIGSIACSSGGSDARPEPSGPITNQSGGPSTPSCALPMTRRPSGIQAWTACAPGSLVTRLTLEPSASIT